MTEHPNYDPGNFRGFRESLTQIEEAIVQRFADSIDFQIDQLYEAENARAIDTPDSSDSATQLAAEAQALARPTADSIDLSSYDNPHTATPLEPHHPVPSETNSTNRWRKLKKALFLSTGRHVKKPRKL